MLFSSSSRLFQNLMPLSSIAASASGVSSALDPVAASPLLWQSGSGLVKRETGPKQMPSANSVYKKKVLNKSESVEKDQASWPLQPLSTSCKDQFLTINPSSEKVDEPAEKAPVSVEGQFFHAAVKLI